MWNEFIDTAELRGTITDKTIKFAEQFGTHLANKEDEKTVGALTTSQLRKFFGEIKRQQLRGYSTTNFIMLKPKLAYAVGRARQSASKKVQILKIQDFYNVIAKAIDDVESTPGDNNKKKAFNNFITIFEAIVAYHKVAEETNKAKEEKEK